MEEHKHQHATMQEQAKEWTVFGERVKAELEKQHISQRQFARKIGITPTTTSRYINGNRIPRAHEIVKSAQALGVTCDYLLGLSSDPHKTSMSEGTDGNRIRSCPFCGAREEDIDARVLYPHPFAKSMLVVMCRKCGGAMIDLNEEHCLNDVIEAWNSREKDV